MSTDALLNNPCKRFEITKDIEIAAPIEIAFEALLEELGPEGQMPTASRCR